MALAKFLQDKNLSVASTVENHYKSIKYMIFSTFSTRRAFTLVAESKQKHFYSNTLTLALKWMKV